VPTGALYGIVSGTLTDEVRIVTVGLLPPREVGLG
jgi:hypothetical protein